MKRQGPVQTVAVVKRVTAKTNKLCARRAALSLPGAQEKLLEMWLTILENTKRLAQNPPLLEKNNISNKNNICSLHWRHGEYEMETKTRPRANLDFCVNLLLKNECGNVFEVSPKSLTQAPLILINQNSGNLCKNHLFRLKAGPREKAVNKDFRKTNG